MVIYNDLIFVILSYGNNNYDLRNVHSSWNKTFWKIIKPNKLLKNSKNSFRKLPDFVINNLCYMRNNDLTICQMFLNNLLDDEKLLNKICSNAFKLLVNTCFYMEDINKLKILEHMHKIKLPDYIFITKCETIDYLLEDYGHIIRDNIINGNILVVEYLHKTLGHNYFTINKICDRKFISSYVHLDLISNLLLNLEINDDKYNEKYNTIKYLLKLNDKGKILWYFQDIGNTAMRIDNCDFAKNMLKDLIKDVYVIKKDYIKTYYCHRNYK